MNPVNCEIFNFLSTHYYIKKCFYKYLDSLIAANLLKCNLLFLKSCKLDKVIPKSFLPQYIRSHQFEPFPALFEDILDFHIVLLKKDINRSFWITKQKFYFFQEAFYSLLEDHFLFSKIIDYAHMKMQNRCSLRKLAHREKLDNLFKSSPWFLNSNPAIIVNKSDYILNFDESTLLGYGLSFSMKNLDPWMDFNNNFRFWQKKQKNSDINSDILLGVTLQLMLNNLNHSLYPKRFYLALKSLNNNSNIIVSRSDKGNNIVILNKCDYLNKSNLLLNDNNVYTKLNTNPLKCSQSSFNKSISNILSPHKDLIPLFKSYLPSISQFYALPKIHKLNTPLRPIISNINCVSYNLSKWLANNLKFLIGNISSSHIKNSLHFKQTIKDIDFTNLLPVSFDVISLFTNVPVNFTLNLLESFLNENNINLPLPFTIFKQLILLTLDHSFFKFNTSFFKQISGLSMGSPLSPIFSNIFMELFEIYYIFPYFSNKKFFWFRYVDDIFALIHKDIEINSVLTFINNLHQNIKFTLELPINNTLPFLDIKISLHNIYPSFSIYRKPTSISSYIHWFSYHDSSVKLATISNLFLRALRICDTRNLKLEINFIYKTFKNLSYPISFINKAYKKALSKFNNTTCRNITYSNILSIPNLTSSIKKNSLPFDLKTVQTNTITLKNILKPHINSIETSSGIYNIPCHTCSSTYIGETNDYNRRLYQHTHDLKFDNLNSALCVHRSSLNHNINISSSNLKLSLHNTNIRKFTESFIIKNTNNINLEKNPLNIDNIYNHFLKNSRFLKNALKKFST